MAKSVNDLIRDLKNIQKNCPRANEWLVKKVASDVNRDAKKGTPVDTGTLKGNWTIDVKGTEATVTNDTEYALYVEFPHRTRNKVRVLPGRYMLRNARDKARGNMDNYAKMYLRKLKEK